MTTPDRARAVARQCAAEGRSTPAAVVEVLLAELQAYDAQRAAVLRVEHCETCVHQDGVLCRGAGR